jgi:hypothetical protein
VSDEQLSVSQDRRVMVLESDHSSQKLRPEQLSVSQVRRVMVLESDHSSQKLGPATDIKKVNLSTYLLIIGLYRSFSRPLPPSAKSAVGK